MKYAILDDAGSVVNIAESAYQVETNWREIPSNTPVAIGDTMGADSTYYSPEGALRMPPEMRAYLEKINLERDLAQKKAETDLQRHEALLQKYETGARPPDEEERL